MKTLTKTRYFTPVNNDIWQGYVAISKSGRATCHYKDGRVLRVNSPMWSTVTAILLNPSAKEITRAQALELVPTKANNLLKELDEKAAAKRIVIIPLPQKLNIQYRNKRGEVKKYTLTPIEKLPDGFTAYVFGGKGVRTFKNEGILNVE